MTTRYDDSAFPIIAANGLGHISDGLTKREYFAAMAMQGILANTNRTESYEDATIFSVGYADALINELNKQP